MVLSPAHPAVAAPAARPGRAGRRSLAALAAALTLVGSGGLVLGGLQADEGGWFTSATEGLATPTSALVTDEVLVESGRPGDPDPDVGDLSQVRVRADAGATPVFVGIGPRDDVAAYLGRSSHDRMVGFELDPFAVRYARSTGTAASPPAEQRFWVATASGPGTQTLLWDKARGPWTAVVMNADGSAGVRARADVGLRFGFLLPGGAALLGGGVLLAGVLVGTRRRTVPAP